MDFESLADIFDRDVDSWNEDDICYLVYKNRFGEVKPYRIVILDQYDSLVEVYDLHEDKIKTFKVENILNESASYEAAKAYAIKEQEITEVMPRNSSTRTSANRLGLFEVCFTGFSKAEKEDLINIAEENDMFVRTKVTDRLGLLVCGPNAGWRKLEDAKKRGVPRVFGLDGFKHFVDSGELSE